MAHLETESGIGGGIGMSKRKALLLMFTLLVCLPVGFVAFLWPTAPRHRITSENFKKIQIGMTLDEVQDILGAPPGDNVPGARYSLNSRKFISLNGAGTRSWSGDDVVIWVGFEDGKVTDTALGHVYRLETGFLDKLRGWLRLPWW